MVPRWLGWTSVALGAALAHVLIDYHIGLFGEHSPEMSFSQAAAVASIGVLFGLWAAVIGAAMAGHADALRGVFWFTVVEAVLINGAVGFLAAPPPADAFPYQDIAHGVSLGAGLVAAWRIRQVILEVGAKRGRWLRMTVAGLIVTNLGILAVQIQYTLSVWLKPNA